MRQSSGQPPKLQPAPVRNAKVCYQSNFQRIVQSARVTARSASHHFNQSRAPAGDPIKPRSLSHLRRRKLPSGLRLSTLQCATSAGWQPRSSAAGGSPASSAPRESPMAPGQMHTRIPAFHDTRFKVRVSPTSASFPAAYPTFLPARARGHQENCHFAHHEGSACVLVRCVEVYAD